MCNAYEQHVKWVEYCKMMQALELGIPTQQTELDLPESDDVRINDMAPVMRAAGNVIELASMNFSFPPVWPKGRTGFQLSVGGASLRQKQSMPHSGIGILRVYVDTY